MRTTLSELETLSGNQLQNDTASVGFFFMNGHSDSLKIVANKPGLDALLRELKLAQRALESGKSHLPGEQEWMRGATKIVSIEPEKIKRSPDTEKTYVQKSNAAAKITLALAILAIIFLTVIGATSVFSYFSN